VTLKVIGVFVRFFVRRFNENAMEKGKISYERKRSEICRQRKDKSKMPLYYQLVENTQKIKKIN
jgi:hypothetical protein